MLTSSFSKNPLDLLDRQPTTAKISNRSSIRWYLIVNHFLVPFSYGIGYYEFVTVHKELLIRLHLSRIYLKTMTTFTPSTTQSQNIYAITNESNCMYQYVHTARQNRLICLSATRPPLFETYEQIQPEKNHPLSSIPFDDVSQKIHRHCFVSIEMLPIRINVTAVELDQFL